MAQVADCSPQQRAKEPFYLTDMKILKKIDLNSLVAHCGKCDTKFGFGFEDTLVKCCGDCLEMFVSCPVCGDFLYIGSRRCVKQDE